MLEPGSADFTARTHARAWAADTVQPPALARTPATLRLAPLLPKPTAVTVSLALHLALIAGGLAGSHSARSGTPSTPVEIEFEDQRAPDQTLGAIVALPSPESPTVSPIATPRPPARARLSSGNPSSHRTLQPAHGSSSTQANMAHAQGDAVPPTIATSNAIESGHGQVPHFDLGNSRDFIAQLPSETDGASADSAMLGGGRVIHTATTFSEREVSAKARLLFSPALHYPAQARSAEIETQVPLELIVDESGKVVDARALTAVGYGLDAEAVRAVRAYRFSPARKAGIAVRVRMLWTVEFRLR